MKNENHKIPTIHNKPLPPNSYSRTWLALVQTEKPQNENPFWMSINGTEFQAMKVARKGFGPAKVLELKKI